LTLILYEEVQNYSFVELPHSKETGWGGKVCLVILQWQLGDRYFLIMDNNNPGKYSKWIMMQILMMMEIN
jgi:hypothetical protein